jgi:hypothetical protein
VVVGMFDSITTNPVGGLYDWGNFHISPLYRTYYFPSLPAQVFESFSESLAQTGMVVMKDYTDNGVLSQLDGTTAGSPVITATLTRFGHHQMRSKIYPDGIDATRLETRFLVRGPDGGIRYDQVHGTEAVTPALGADVLDLLAKRLVIQLVSTPAFLASVGGAR